MVHMIDQAAQAARLERKVLSKSLAVIRAARPSLTLMPRAIVEAVFLSEGFIGSARDVAERLGMPNRFVLARLLKREMLPPLHRLASLAMLESWVRASERDAVSLCHLAFRAHRHPSACYRLVREITGLRWKVVRARGSAWVEAQLVEELAKAADFGKRVSSRRS